MKRSDFERPIVMAAALFVLCTVASWYLTASFFTASLDEGIYLNGGRRIAQGERLYVDFLSFVGPVLFWVQAGLSGLFGNQLAQLRLSTSISLGAIAAGLFYVGRSMAGTSAGWYATLAWFGICLQVPARVEVNHRWVSMGFYSLAMAALVGSQAGSRIWNGAAGALVGLATFTTPSFTLSAGLIGGYLFVRSRDRFWPYILGGVTSCVLVVAVLALQGELDGFVDGLRWAADNYQEANRFPFGRFPVAVSYKHLLPVYLGAIAMPLSALLIGGYTWYRRETRLEMPAVFGVALFVATYPKWDAYSLHFVAGLYFVLVFSIVWLSLPDRWRGLMRGLGAANLVFGVYLALLLSNRLTLIPTRAGTLIGDEASERTMARLDEAIPAKSNLFVYPYLTGLYTLLDAKVTARRDFLQPGMMNAKDEEIVLADLTKHAPQYLFWQDFPDEDVLRIWPNSNPGKHRFTRLESWFRANYDPGLKITESNIRGQVWVRKH